MSKSPSDEAVLNMIHSLPAEEKRLLLAVLRQLAEDTEGCQ